MQKPELIEMSPRGATIHSYEITGGQTTFQRFLGCYLGTCEFHNTLDEARESLKF